MAEATQIICGAHGIAAASARHPVGAAAAGQHSVQEIVRTNDPVLISAIEALLGGAHIPYLILDQNMSVLEGSIGMLPRRILVEVNSEREARTLLTDAGLGNELRPHRP